VKNQEPCQKCYKCKEKARLVAENKRLKKRLEIMARVARQNFGD
jgi:hypothetical protein